MLSITNNEHDVYDRKLTLFFLFYQKNAEVPNVHYTVNVHFNSDNIVFFKSSKLTN